jgi:broad specificity phosphatase PhoE
MKLYLIRHGRTYLNKYNKMQGWSDSPLTDDGIKTAKECALKLKAVPFDAIYCSDLGRTVETAEVIASYIESLKGKEIIKMKALRESFFGGFEGESGGDAWREVASTKGFDEVNDFFSNTPLREIMDAMKEADPYHDAEAYDEFWERVSKGLNDISEISRQKEHKNILVVTHGNTIRNIVHKMDQSIDISQNIKNSSITILEYIDEGYLVESFNG